MSLQARILYPPVIFNERKASTRLNGKTILITGATFGIGEALVRYLFSYEVTLILVARTTEKLLAIKTESLAPYSESRYVLL
jgi:short-subunit dehydrogenase